MNKQDISDTMTAGAKDRQTAIREAVCEALDHVGLDMIRSGEFFGTNQPATKEGEE